MGGLVLVDDSDSDSGSSGEQQTSMGKESLRLLIKGVVADGKRGYLPVRNTLQKAEYLGRALTRAEKNSVADILEELDATTTTAVSPSGNWRRSEFPPQRCTTRQSTSTTDAVG